MAVEGEKKKGKLKQRIRWPQESSSTPTFTDKDLTLIEIATTIFSNKDQLRKWPSFVVVERETLSLSLSFVASTEREGQWETLSKKET